MGGVSGVASDKPVSDAVGPVFSVDLFLNDLTNNTTAKKKKKMRRMQGLRHRHRDNSSGSNGKTPVRLLAIARHVRLEFSCAVAKQQGHTDAGVTSGVTSAVTSGAASPVNSAASNGNGNVNTNNSIGRAGGGGDEWVSVLLKLRPSVECGPAMAAVGPETAEAAGAVV